MKASGSAARIAAATACLLALAVPAWATNGMYLAGYGSEAAGRAGANIAVADRSLGLQANPAGIGQLQGQHLGLDLQVLAPKMHYGGDMANNSIDAKDVLFAMPSISWVRGSHGSPWTYGFGFISQGGMGATFEGYRTPFGNTDGTFSEVRFLTATPTVAYTPVEDVSLGASVNVGYSDVKFRFYPNTSFYSDMGTPSDPTDDMGFFGMDLTDRAKTVNTSVRLGALWHATEQVQLGATWQSRTEGKYENGTLQMNMAAIGLGPVRYDAAVDGFTWPQQFGLGVQLRPTPQWIVAADARRYLWNGAMQTITVQGTNPDKAVPGPFATMNVPFVFQWEDQWAWIVGTEYRVNDAFTVRGGYNFGKSPVPASTLNPLFPATTEQHAAVGASWTWMSNTVNLAIERAFEATETNMNTNQNVNPFGPGATVDHSQWTVSLGFTKAFSGK